MTIHSEHKLDDLTPHQLIQEVKEIADQYSQEVSSSRRTWPKSIRERVLALARLGVPCVRIGNPLCQERCRTGNVKITGAEGHRKWDFTNTPRSLEG